MSHWLSLCWWPASTFRFRGRELPVFYLLVVVGVVGVVMTVSLMTPLSPLWDSKEAHLDHDARLFFQWEGFGQEKGLYNFTMVTALVDIGRGKWNRQSRSFHEYLLYMQRVLKLDVNMVVYVDRKAVPLVQWVRRGREARTKVVETTLQDLPYYRYRSQIQDVMNSAEYQLDNELVRKKLCEATIPDYDIVQWSKLYFLHDAIARDLFHNDVYVWIDAGYGRGQDIHPAEGGWRPRSLFKHVDKVSFLEREDIEKYRPEAYRLHKMSINILVGGFFGGGSRVLERLYKLQQQLIERWLRTGVVDDDQTLLMHLYFQHPELFRLTRANWYDAFKIFGAED